MSHTVAFMLEFGCLGFSVIVLIFICYTRWPPPSRYCEIPRLFSSQHC